MRTFDEIQAPVVADVQSSDQPIGLESAVPKGFRIEVRTVPESELEALNEKEGRTGARRFRPAELELERIAQTHSSSPDHLDRWIYHPDERVPIALLQSKILKPRTEEALPIVAELIVRAIREAGADRWTPLLDALSASGHWPRGWPPADRERLSAIKSGAISEEEFLESRIMPWAKSQTNPSSLAAVIRLYRAQVLARVIAGQARALDITLVKQILARSPDLVLELGTRCKELPREVGEYLVELFVRNAAMPQASKPEINISRANAVLCYKLFQDHGYFLADAQLNTLLSSIRARAEHSPQGEDAPSRMALDLLEAFVLKKPDKKEIALQYIDAVGEAEEPGRVVRFLKRLHDLNQAEIVTLELSQAVVWWFGHEVDVCEALAQYSVARSDPEIRARLLDTDSWIVADCLLEDARPEEFARLFRRLAPHRPDLAADALGHNSAVARATLDWFDLLPLLQDEDRDVRMQAVALLNELGKKAPSPRRQGVS